MTRLNCDIGFHISPQKIDCDPQNIDCEYTLELPQ